MAKLSDDDILAIINRELDQSVGGNGCSIDANRQKAMEAYLGDKGEVEKGKSSVVSTDVADAIEWIMPEIVKAFTQNNEVVTFDPISPNDTKQAEIESRFVYDTLMKDNDGFITIHTFVKDALMQKNGFVKAYYEDQTEAIKEDYTGLIQPELEMLQQDPELEITGLTETITDDNIPVYDVNCVRKHVDGKVTVIAVAPEEFRINKMHNSVNINGARFCAHSMLKTRSDLLEDGFDEAIVKDMPTDDSDIKRSSYRFSMMGEDTSANINNGDVSQTLYEVSECYLKIDLDGDGIAERCKITVAGIDEPTHILEIEEVDSWPFISATAIMMSHKLFGLSIYDRLKEIQEQKTALLRNVFDNIYLNNNQRLAVSENLVNLDDVLFSRPGGVVRVKSANVGAAIAPINTAQLGGDTYRLFDYLDQVRAGRSGVSPEGSIHDSAMGDSVGSQGLDRLLSQKEELVGLMVRVFAETGIKPLCNRIRDLLIKHHDLLVHYEFRGDWVKLNPSQWAARKKSTVRVGTGSGNRKEQAAAIMQIIGMQEKMLANPSQAMVDDEQLFASVNDFAKSSGMPGAGRYFLDPTSPEGQQKKQQVQQANQQRQQAELKEKQLLADAQTKIAQAETVKAEAAQQSVQLKAQLENQKQKHDLYVKQSDAEIKMLKQQLDEAKTVADSMHKDEELEFRYYDADQKAQLAREQMSLQKVNSESDSEKEQSDD